MNKLEEKEVLKTPVFTVVEKTFENTGFKPVGLNCKNWVTVIVADGDYDSNPNVLVVNENRWGWEGNSTGFIFGTAEDDEFVSKTALRELEEESGLHYTSDDIEPLGHYNPNPAYFNNTMYVFLVKDPDLLKNYNERGTQKLDEDEDCKPYLERLDNLLNPAKYNFTLNGMVLSALHFWQNN